MVIRDYYEWLYASKLHSLEKKINAYIPRNIQPNKIKPWKKYINFQQTYNQQRDWISNPNLPTRKVPEPGDFTGKF